MWLGLGSSEWQGQLVWFCWSPLWQRVGLQQRTCLLSHCLRYPVIIIKPAINRKYNVYICSLDTYNYIHGCKESGKELAHQRLARVWACQCSQLCHRDSSCCLILSVCHQLCLIFQMRVEWQIHQRHECMSLHHRTVYLTQFCRELHSTSLGCSLYIKDEWKHICI